ncbi:MAG: hypothetical protein HZB64_08130 [Rhodocyclales bacterium]|nr:hypothetical protein [Rhodocyclales bacterium]
MERKHTFLILVAIPAALLPLSGVAADNTAPPAKPPVIRAPLAPPPINDLSRAYEFRTRLSGDPQCQRFATDADAVFLQGGLDDTQKISRLKAIAAAAGVNGCLAPATAY